MSTTKVIDLSEFRTEGVLVFAGRDRGMDVRRKAGLDDVDKQERCVEVRIPDDTFSLTSSFFLGLFGDSVRMLGEELFRQRYTFVGLAIREVLDDGIREALRTDSPF